MSHWTPFDQQYSIPIDNSLLCVVFNRCLRINLPTSHQKVLIKLCLNNHVQLRNTHSSFERREIVTNLLFCHIYNRLFTAFYILYLSLFPPLRTTTVLKKVYKQMPQLALKSVLLLQYLDSHLQYSPCHLASHLQACILQFSQVIDNLPVF